MKIPAKFYYAMVFAIPLFLIGALTFLLLNPQNANANQSEFCQQFLNGSGTTTKTYITAGNSTTTLEAVCSDGSTAVDSAFFTAQLLSSSTPPSLAVRFEVSRDRVDWYPYPVETTTNSTTTQMSTGANAYLFGSMASSTDMAGTGGTIATGNATGTLYMLSVKVPGTPLPYIRAKFYVPAGAPAVDVDAELYVKREKLAR